MFSRLLLTRQIKQIDDEITSTQIGISYPFFQLSLNDYSAIPFALIFSTLCDVKLWKFIITAANLLLGGPYIESNWNSSTEMFKFVLLIGILINFIMVLMALCLRNLLADETIGNYLDGNHIILIGFSIIYKQMLPETTIFELKNMSIFSKNFRFKLLPIFLMFVLTIIECFTRDITEFITIWVTFFISWMYLRFFQRLDLSETNLNSGEEEVDSIIVGDASDTFQLIYFFPDIVKPVLRPIFNTTYDICCKKLHIIKPFETDDVEKGNFVAGKRGAKPVPDPLVLSTQTEDRRRQLAMEVLEERMA